MDALPPRRAPAHTHPRPTRPRARPRDPRRQVRPVPRPQCPPPQGPRPKGHFGFITDLKRLAADPNYIVPKDPDGSYLWTQIDDGDMPPDKAKAGPLTDEEKQEIQYWIKDGAPPPPDSAAFTPPP